MQFCTLRVRIDYKTIEISKILCYNICACQAAYLGKGELYHPAMKPPGIDKRTDKPTEAASAAPAAEEQANFANGQEKLHLLMADDRIPDGAKLYR